MDRPSVAVHPPPRSLNCVTLGAPLFIVNLSLLRFYGDRYEEDSTMSTSTDYEDEFSQFLYNATLILDNFPSRQIFNEASNLGQCADNPEQFVRHGNSLNFVLSQIVQDYWRIVQDSEEVSILVYTRGQPS